MGFGSRVFWGSRVLGFNGFSFFWLLGGLGFRVFWGVGCLFEKGLKRPGFIWVIYAFLGFLGVFEKGRRCWGLFVSRVFSGGGDILGGFMVFCKNSIV